MTIPSVDQHGNGIAPENIDELMRAARKRNYVRSPITFAVLGSCAGVNYLILVLLREAFRPDIPPGGWVIEPGTRSRLLLAGYGAAILFTIPMSFISRWWRRRDLERGLFVLAKPKYTLTQLIAMWFMAGVFVIFVFGGAAMSCSDYVVISADSVRISFRFVNRTYDIHRLKAITVVPEGYRIEERAEDGPRARMHFDDGVEKEFGEDNRLTNADIQAICSYLAEHSGVKVELDPDATERVPPP